MTDNSINSATFAATEIAFGLNRETDEKSLKVFITRFADRELLSTLLPRMDDGDIRAVVDLLSCQMKKYFTENEYHRLFLGDK